MRRFLTLTALFAAAAFPTVYAADTPPRVISKVDPQCTQEARNAKVDSSVVLAFTVNADGTASNIAVFKGLGKGLDENAIDSLKQWRFQPSARDGNPVPKKARVEIFFRCS
jgi:TonB family protein